MVPTSMTDFITTDSGFLENCWRYLVLGIIQGITEFLPISSTAHLKVLPILFGWGDPGISISAVLQIGSVLAVFLYFRSDLKAIFRSVALKVKKRELHNEQSRLGFGICLGTIPILTAGIIIKVFWAGFEDSFLRSIPSIALISILMSVLLGLAEKNGMRWKSLDRLSKTDSLLIGLGQVLALIPGVSRSGITLTTALLCGWKRQDAARFSFLLGIPAILFAGLVETKAALATQVEVTNFLPLICGIVASAVTSWIAIDWFLGYLQKHSTWNFVIYRLFFGISLLSWWWSIQ